MKKINIDCVKMVREIRDKLYLKTKDMSKEELIDFYNNKPTKATKKPNNPRKVA